MATQTPIATSVEIADGIVELIHDDLPTDAAELRTLLVHAARAGKLAGLQQAQKYMFNGWPQGQYDRFNEHTLAATLKDAIKRVTTRMTRP